MAEADVVICYGEGGGSANWAFIAQADGGPSVSKLWLVNYSTVSLQFVIDLPSRSALTRTVAAGSRDVINKEDFFSSSNLMLRLSVPVVLV